MVDGLGQPSDKVALYLLLNASFESGYANPVDDAIRKPANGEVERIRETGRIAVRFRQKTSECVGAVTVASGC